MMQASSTSMRFLPTPSARRATPSLDSQPQLNTKISTHALREEGDRAFLLH